MSKTAFAFALVLLVGCAGEAPPTGVDANPDLAAGGSRGKPSPGGSGVTIVEPGFFRALDIDNQGRVTGWGQCCSPVTSLVWDPVSQQSTALPGVAGGDASAVRMNESLEIAGYSWGGSASRAVVWEAGAAHELATGPSGGGAEDIADPLTPGGARWVAGRVGSMPSVWSVTGSGAGFTSTGVTLLPVPAGAEGIAFAVNSAGTVAGSYRTAGATIHAPAIWAQDGAGQWQLTSLSLPAGHNHGQALDVNAAGAVVGHSSAPGQCSRGVVWATPTSIPATLPGLSSGNCAFPQAINDAGYIAGGGAAFWSPLTGGGYSVKDLGRPKGIRLAEARGLGEPRLDGSGVRIIEVAGQGISPAGSNRAIIWRVALP